MHAQAIWHKADQEFQDKFQGDYGLPAFREAVIIVLMFLSHKALKAKLDPRHHAALDREWYGSLLANHPLHGLRKTVQDAAADWAVEADDYFGKPLQHKFAWLNQQVPRVERFIDGLFGPPSSPGR